MVEGFHIWPLDCILSLFVSMRNEVANKRNDTLGLISIFIDPVRGRGCQGTLKTMILRGMQFKLIAIYNFGQRIELLRNV